MNWVVMTLIGFLAIIVLVTLVVLLRVFSAGSKVKKTSAEKKPEPAKKAPNKPSPVRTGSGTVSRSNTPAQPASRPKPQPKPQTSAEPEPEKSLAKKVLEEEDADPVAEAEIFLTYGLNDKAVEVLAKHLANNPSDEAAIAMLAKARQ